MSKITNLNISPLNMQSASYAQVNTSSLAPAISIAIITLVTEAVDDASLERSRPALAALLLGAIDPAEGDPLGIIRPAPCQIQNVSLCVHHGVLTADVLATFTPEQRDWLDQGRYYQTVIFADRSHNIDLHHEGGALAMIMQDGWVNRHHSLNPEDHAALAVPKALHEAFTQQVDGLYENGKAIWHPELHPLRNDLQIAIRAMATGGDVKGQLQAFRASGKDYFLW